MRRVNTKGELCLATTAPDAAGSVSARNQILELVRGYFARYGSPARGARILAAVSGGADSVAMLNLLCIIAKPRRWTIAVAHVNHGLRGAAATRDETFVRGLAETLGLEFYHRRLVPERRSLRNVQHWARDERYAFFQSIADRHSFDFIAVAHHLDDRAETVAAAVLDAAGTFALSGIPPVRGRIFRPLFDVPASLIRDFLRQAAIAYRTDKSNSSSKYKRNRIRQSHLPEWSRENPAIVEGLARLGEQLWKQRVLLEKQARAIVARAVVGVTAYSVTLDARRLSRHDIALDPYVLRALADYLKIEVVPRTSLAERFFKLRRAKVLTGQRTVEQGELVICRSQNQFVVSRKRPRTGGSQSAKLPTVQARLVRRSESNEFDDNRLAQFDFDAVSGTLSVRWPLPGDRYQPFGMTGTKKLFDLLAERKVPSFERGIVPVVVDDKGILWPVGHPIAHRARLTDQTKRVLQARLQEGSWKSRS